MATADHGSIPTHPAPVALASAIAGNSVANPLKTPQFLDVEVDQTPRFLVVIAHNRFRWGQVFDPRQSGTPENPADCGRRDAGLQRDMLPAKTLAA